MTFSHLRTSKMNQLILRKTLSKGLLQGRLLPLISRYNSQINFHRARRCLSDLRGASDDPDKQVVDGMYGGRLLSPEHEKSYPHINVLENLERPDPRLDLVPVLSPSQIIKKNKTNELFGSTEDAQAAADLVAEIQNVKDWSDVSDELEVKLTRLAELNTGDSVVILGGGISGLSLAWILANARPDLHIKVLEEKSQVGGWMNSAIPNELSGMSSTDGLFEWGPRTLQAGHSGTHLLRLILTQMGLLDKLAFVRTWSKANRKGLLFDGMPYQLPANNSEIFKFLRGKISKGVKLSPLKDIIARARPLDVRDESVESYVSRRFGPVVAQRFVSAVMRGIYAGDSDELSARSVARIGRIYALEHESPSMLATMMNGSGQRADKYAAACQSAVLQAILKMPFEEVAREMSKYSVAVFEEGIQWLPKTLAQRLQQLPNVEILKNNRVSSIEKKDENVVSVQAEETTVGLKKTIDANLVVATMPGYSVAPLVKKTSVPLSERIDKSLKYTTVAVVNVNIPHKSVGHNWFGYLVPKNEENPEDLLGVIFNTAVREAAYSADRIPLPHPFETIKLEQKDREAGESLLEHFDADKYADEHERRVLMTDSLERRPEQDLPSHSNLTLMIGGHLWDNMSKLPTEAEIIEKTYSVFKKHLGTDLKAEADVNIQVKIHEKCIPQYTVGHRERMQPIKDEVARVYNNRLFLAGTSFGRGVGIGDCVVDSFNIASRYSKERKLMFPSAYMNNWLSLTYPSTLV